MDRKTNEEVTRYELESYVRLGTEVPSVTTRQTNAVKKMISLPEKNFNELISDVVNETNRRNSMPYSVPETPMQKKLCKIHETGFKDLILDILLVIDQRSSEKKNRPESVDDLVESLDRLISSLREDIVNEEKMMSQIYLEDDISKKILLFVKYVHHTFGKRNEGTELTEHMMEQLSRHSENDILNGFSFVFDLDTFLKKCDESQYGSLPEYKYHSDNIKNLQRSEMNPGVKERLMKHEVSQMYASVTLRNTRMEKVPRNQLENKVHDLIDALCKIKDEVDDKGSADMDISLGDVINSVKDISGHIEQDELVKQIYIDQLRSEIDLLEQMDGKEKNSGETFIIVFSAVDLIRRILVEISHSNS